MSIRHKKFAVNPKPETEEYGSFEIVLSENSKYAELIDDKIKQLMSGGQADFPLELNGEKIFSIERNGNHLRLIQE